MINTAKTFLLFLLLVSLPALANFDSDEALIYPSGFGTTDTLKAKQWYLAPPPWGWMAYGATPSLTVSFDYPAALFGVGAAMTRWKLPFSTGPMQYSVELYGAQFPKDFKDERKEEYTIRHDGFVGWLRAQTTYRLSSDFRFHAFVGPDYVSRQVHVTGRKAKVNFAPQEYSGHWTLSYGADIEFRATPWMFIHANYSKGNTFLFVDQVPYKDIFAYSFSFAPFPTTSHGFFSRMRVELHAIWVSAPQVGYYEALPLPLYPTLYWQWNG